MDFSLIERHPWWTAGIVVGGGVLLYVVLHRGSGSSSASTGVAYSGADPALANANASLQAATQQQQAQLQGLSIQAQAQLGLAAIGADVSKYSTRASQDVTDFQTAAQLQLGLGTLDTQYKMAALSAAQQMNTVNALVAAFRGPTAGAASGSAPGAVAPPAGAVYPAPYSTVTNPISQGVSQVSPSVAAPVNVPVYSTAPTDRAIIPGGTQLIPFPSYTPVGAWPNKAAIDYNQQLQIDWQNATLAANNNNNRNQCLANADQSRGQPNYGALVAACG